MKPVFLIATQKYKKCYRDGQKLYGLKPVAFQGTTTFALIF